MKKHTVLLALFALVFALPAVATGPDGAAPAIDTQIATDSAAVALHDAIVANQPMTPMEMAKKNGDFMDAETYGSCTATAQCAGGGSVSCQASSGSCWFLDGCYAVCNNQYTWCGYRPNPCPI